MEKWVVSAKKADFKGIGERFGIDQVTARIIRNRDIVGDAAIREYLQGGLADFHNPREMKDTFFTFFSDFVIFQVIKWMFLIFHDFHPQKATANPFPFPCK